MDVSERKTNRFTANPIVYVILVLKKSYTCVM